MVIPTRRELWAACSFVVAMGVACAEDSPVVTTGSALDGGGSHGTSDVPHCPGDNRMQCAVDCEVFDCGAEASSFDENGCLRDFCQWDADCENGEVCNLRQLVDGAAGSDATAADHEEICITPFWGCSPSTESESCSCGAPGVCSGYCVSRD